MRYGPRPNVELLLHSGFTEPANAFDVYDLEVPLETDDPKLATFLRALLDKARVPRRPNSANSRGTLHRKTSTSVQPKADLKAALLGAVADKKEAAHLMRLSNTDHTLWTPLDATHDLKAARKLQALCDAAAARVNTAGSRTPGNTRRAKLADAFMDGERDLLLAAQAYATTWATATKCLVAPLVI